MAELAVAPQQRERARAQLHAWCRASRGQPAPRVLAVVAHPDDEALGLGARMFDVAAHLHVAYVSDGAPEAEQFYRPHGFRERSDYARARRAEARQALALAGLSSEQAHELGLVDQTVAFGIAKARDWLLELLGQLAPDAVLTHAYEGGHPDHDATACAVHLALRQWASSGQRPLALWEFASYHLGEQGLVLGCFLPDALAPEEHVALDERARADKQRLLECHATQRSFCRLYPLDVERFRLAPAYDFTRPPAAPFHYDRVAWGVNGEQFLRCVQSARRAPSEASC